MTFPWNAVLDITEGREPRSFRRCAATRFARQIAQAGYPRGGNAAAIAATIRRAAEALAFEARLAYAAAFLRGDARREDGCGCGDELAAAIRDLLRLYGRRLEPEGEAEVWELRLPGGAGEHAVAVSNGYVLARDLHPGGIKAVREAARDLPWM